MYVADSVSYLGLAALLIARGAFPSGSNFLRFFQATCSVIAVLTCAFLIMGFVYFARSRRQTGLAAGGHAMTTMATAIVFHGPERVIEIREIPAAAPARPRDSRGGARLHDLRKRPS